MPCFGTPPDETLLMPETRFPPPDGTTAKPILDAYRALDRASEGKYAEFLKQAARCSTCAADPRIRPHKQPIPLMCGTAGFEGADAARFDAAHRHLAPYRRPDGSIVFNPDDGIGDLTRFLDDHRLKGLAIGHCGWGDLTARLRGKQLGDGVAVMILGADWYPLTQCSNFLLDLYSEQDNALRKFFSRFDAQLLEGGVGGFLRNYRVYLGNTLLCYRTGWDTTGERNLSPLSFENCRDHLRRHIGALAPRILVTLGKHPYRAVASLLVGESDLDNDILDQLRAGKRLDQVMPPFCAAHPGRGITGRLANHSLTFLPLYHPTFMHLNWYQGDYETLNALLLGTTPAPPRSISQPPPQPPIEPEALVKDFLETAKLAGLAIERSQVSFEIRPAPHQSPPRLPPGSQAVYVFTVGDRCLKVGKAGPKTKARFTTQHYGLHARSTLARSLLDYRAKLTELLAPTTVDGITDLSEATVGPWIRENAGRIHFFLPASLGAAPLSLLEAFLQCRLKPCFEGKVDSKRGSS